MILAFGKASSTPEARWEPEPSTRGTFSIISTCLITLSLCLWRVLHLNIPSHNSNLRQFGRKVGWVVLGLLAPELVAFAAYQQLRVALRLTRNMRLLLDQSDRLRQEDVEEGAGKKLARQHQWTLVHSFYATMGGYTFDSINHESHQCYKVINASKLLLIAQNKPEMIPDIPREEIVDKSKANVFAKFLVFFQTSWFGVQCTNRIIQNQSLSLLELNVVAHVILALFINLLWWKKPLDVATQIRLPEREYDRNWENDERIHECLKRGFKRVFSHISDWPLTSKLQLLEDKDVRGWGALSLGLVIAGLFYGGFHLLAWNAPFASRSEQILWRYSGICIAASGVVFCAIIFPLYFSLGDESDKEEKNFILESLLKSSKVVLCFLLIVFILSYFLARGFLVVESILQLAHLPQGAYNVPPWSRYFPHIS